ncbi:metallopeptidase family protein [Enhygromyxa salina]|uniref:Possibl zinc metallo-peptidase n=1 Tax=Enhygromyxa salina TaxID=215803 RepID=A0A2S9YT35_9BACT|nr:metallopeptidase family protein [Enhygromyxa salina]PRQ08254.1 Possibl zinc metallo-peptidase [Enhygromyxa salina]
MFVDDIDTDPRWLVIAEALELRDLDRASSTLDELAAQIGERHPRILHERALVAWEREGPESAIAVLDQLLRDEPTNADAHYMRAIACESADDREGMIIHFLETLRLDTLADADQDHRFHEQDLDLIEASAEQVMAQIPEEFREHLRNVPIVLEPRPHPEVVREGFDPRALGLFEGLEQGRLAAGEPSQAPTRIVLFYANLLADAPDDETLFDEIEITLLHEIGHFFGLDEDDVERLGLE